MPEALAILAVLVVAVAAYVSAWLQAKNPSLQNPQLEVLRLQHQDAWLRDRLELARQENWGHEMVESIASELETTSRQMAAAQLAPARRSPASTDLP